MEVFEKMNPTKTESFTDISVSAKGAGIKRKRDEQTIDTPNLKAATTKEHPPFFFPKFLTSIYVFIDIRLESLSITAI